jgi:hypothetical protein
VTKGQAVSGLTVTEGTEPGSFSGEVLGVIRDGLGPGLDLVLARLSSPEIARVGGIWQGMSGSPVYAADGRLVGAVSYSLSFGPSPVAGITPAAEMYRMLRDAPSSPTGPARVATGAEEVDLPPTMTQRLVSTDTATRAEAQQGLTRLPLPLGISGMANARRLQQAGKALGLEGARVHQTGAVADAGEPIPVVAGGNLAASMSYGDVSTVGVGTATAVCGVEVVGFGHPMNYTGPSRMSMHGADAVYVQEDPAGSPFKLANAAAPVGAITQDRLSGLAGTQLMSAVPDTTDITSYVDVPGEWSRTGTTHISVPEVVPDIAAFHLLANQDRVFDGMGGGSAKVGWVVRGRRAHGKPFVLAREDEYAAKADLSFEPTLDLYEPLAQIQLYEGEDIRIDSVRTTSTMTRDVRAYTVAKVRVRSHGRWRALSTRRPLLLRGGTTRRFEVQLRSARLGGARTIVKLEVPRGIGRKSGVLEILGGSSYFSGGGELGDPASLAPAQPASFDALLGRLRRAPRNDQVLAHLMLFRANGSTLERMGRTRATAVVDGGVSVEVQGVPARRR